MKISIRIATYVALTALACTSVTAFADDHAYTEGLIVNVARIRTVDGKFDEYMKMARHHLEEATGSSEEGRIYREL